MVSADILSDARHCWRKNAVFSDIVCIGNITHRIVRIETVTKADDLCSQRHEMLGVKRIYEHFDSQNISVERHGHDNNASVTKYVREERQPTENAKDTWHVAKGIAREAKKITSGPAKMSGKTWHPQLSDKAASIKTHIFWSMKTCEGNSEKLRGNIMNLVEHYKGNHKECHPTARCQTDEHYVATKDKISDSCAEDLLTGFFKKILPYKEAENYKHCIDTHYVESFNNALLQYMDKRISFGIDTYLLRRNLAVLDWNEHVDRRRISETYLMDATNPRRRKAMPVLSKKTNNFKRVIFQNWITELNS